MATTQPVLVIQTDFQEKGDLILSRARRATTLSMKSPYVRTVTAQITEILHVSLTEHTPVGPDQWHHTGGTLQQQTDVSMETVGEGEGTAQWVISAIQDAENPYGTQYAPFVILGHRTRGSTSRVVPYARAHNIGWVTENPYPSAAVEDVIEEINGLLDLMARSIAEETVRYLTSGDGL